MLYSIGLFLFAIGLIGMIIFSTIAVISLFKKNGKPKRNFIIVGIFFLLFIVGTFTGEPPDKPSAVVEEGNQTENEEKKEDSEEKEPENEKKKEESKEEEPEPEKKAANGVYELDYKENINGLEIEIPEIEVTKRKILVTILTKNTTEDTMTFYPDQGDIIIDDTQIGANMFSNKGDVSGDIHGGIKKEGIIAFLAGDKEFNVENINKVRLKLGNIYSDDYDFESVDFDETLELKSN